MVVVVVLSCCCEIYCPILLYYYGLDPLLVSGTGSPGERDKGLLNGCVCVLSES